METRYHHDQPRLHKAVEFGLLAFAIIWSVGIWWLVGGIPGRHHAKRPSAVIAQQQPIESPLNQPVPIQTPSDQRADASDRMDDGIPDVAEAIPVPQPPTNEDNTDLLPPAPKGPPETIILPGVYGVPDRADGDRELDSIRVKPVPHPVKRADRHRKRHAHSHRHGHGPSAPLRHRHCRG